MIKDRTFLTGGIIFILIILVAMTTAIRPTVDPADFAELSTEILITGEGERGVVSGDSILVHYTGTLKDGTEFDSSRDREPFPVTIGSGQVIPGWEEGILGMKLGESRRLEIPSSLAYGPQGQGTIPGGAGLIFDVELVEFVEQ